MRKETVGSVSLLALFLTGIGALIVNKVMTGSEKRRAVAETCRPYSVEFSGKIGDVLYAVCGDVKLREVRGRSDDD